MRNNRNKPESPMVKKITELRQTYIDKAKQMLCHEMSSLIQSPILSYRFTAYTPYFNDGSECVYSVGDVFFKIVESEPMFSIGDKVNIKAIDAIGLIKEINADVVSVELRNGKVLKVPISEVTTRTETGSNYEGGYTDCYSTEGDIKIKTDRIVSFIESIPHEILKDAFDDHARITVSKDTVTVHKADHE